MSESPRWKLDRADAKKLGTSLLLCLAGGVVAFLASLPTEIEWGSWGPVVGAFCPFLVNMVRKWISNKSEVPMPKVKLKAYVAVRALPYMLPLLLLLLMVLSICCNQQVKGDTVLWHKRQMDNVKIYGNSGAVGFASAEVSTGKTYVYAAEMLLKEASSAVVLQDQLANIYNNSRDGIPAFEFIANSTPPVTQFIQFDRPLILRNGLIIEITNANVKIHYQDIN